MPKSSKKTRAMHTTRRQVAAFAQPAKAATAVPVEVELLALVAAGDAESLKKAEALALETTLAKQKQIRMNMWTLLGILDDVANKWGAVMDYTGQRWHGQEPDKD